MKTSYLPALILLLLGLPPAYGQKTPQWPKHPVAEATVCDVLKDPSAYNNRMVKIRGYVEISFEYSMLLDSECPDSSIWFALANNLGPPGLVVSSLGRATPGGRDSKGRKTPPLDVRLIRDANFEEFEHYLSLSAKGETCANEPALPLPPDCTTYRVTATFTGRIDGVSKEIHEAHLRRSPNDPSDRKGFGQMGLFDAQIVVQSIDRVVAEDKSKIRESQRPPD